MGLSRKAIEEIRSFKLNGGGDVGICLLKQQTTPGGGHLIISLGGSGADMLREVKGLINRNCCSDTDKNEAPERVSFLAFDMDAHEREKASSIKNGRVTLDDNELIILSGSGLPILLDPVMMDINRATYPWIYRWLDTQCYSLYYHRQAGRAMLFLEIDRVIEKLRTAILDLTMGARVQDLNIYILSGISGGTGGGTFLDMAYIVRNVAEEVVGSSISGRMNIRILGYLLMPDVNLLKADNEASRSIILKNAGAALQELDNAMRLPETGDYYECQYSQTLTIITNKAPFDYVHLISARARGKSMPDEPYQHCLDTVAGSILCFVSCRQAVGAAAKFPVDAFYSNIASMKLQARAKNAYKERINSYLSIGYDCWEIPADRLVKYVFTLMFSKIDDLFKNEPVQGDADRFMKEMRYHCEDLVEILMGKRINPLNPAQFDSTMLFGQEGIELGEYLPFDERCRDIDNRFHALMSEFGKELKEELQESFRDAERGPIWTGDLLVSTFSHIRSLDVLIEDEKNSAIQCRSAAWNKCTAILQDINRIRENCRSLTGDGKIDDYIDEYIDAWNEYYNSYLEAHCYDLLSGNTAVLEETGEGYERGFYDEVLKTAAIYNNKWLDVTRKVLEELRNVVRENTDEIKKTNAARGGFLWEKGDIPNLDRAIDNIIDQAGISKSDLLQRFLDRLPDKADEWEESVGFRKFLEEFIEDEAQPVLNASLENLLSSNFAGDGALSQSVKEDLMPKMKNDAVPLFDGNITNRVIQGISIPPGCPQIQAGVEAFNDYRDEYWSQTCFLRNRISVISAAVGLSLHDYAWSEECEKQINLDPNVRGLFLNQGEEDFEGTVNHMKMPLPLVIPTRKRSADQKALGILRKFEEYLVKEFREMRSGRYPFLYFRKTSDLQDYDLDLVLSDDLIHSPFREMIKEENYLNYNHEVDAKKLTQLIKELKDIRYNTGLPGKTTLPRRLIICRNLLNAATQEMKDRYAGLPDEDAEKIKEEVAWEVAEWYYVSYYNFYMYAKAEKAKYDEIEEAIKRFESILDDLEQKPMRCATMARMLASGTVKFDHKYLRYTYLMGGEDVSIVHVEAVYLRVKDMALCEALEKLRKGDDEDKYLYNELCNRAYDNYDELVKEYYLKAYDEKDERSGKFPETAEYIRKFIELYKRIDDIRTEVKEKWEAIAAKLRTRDHVDNAAENPKTKEFYEAYYQGLDRYIKQDGQIAACAEKLKIRGADDNMLPEDEIFEKKIEEDRKETGGDGNTWTCPRCGWTGNTGFFCLVCTPKPVPVITWTCPKCGRIGNTDRFCPGCGTPKPVPVITWTCPKCGRIGNTGRFCSGCGFRKPAGMVVPTREWTCHNCGRTGNTERFCPTCGTKRP